MESNWPDRSTRSLVNLAMISALNRSNEVGLKAVMEVLNEEGKVA